MVKYHYFKVKHRSNEIGPGSHSHLSRGPISMSVDGQRVDSRAEDALATLIVLAIFPLPFEITIPYALSNITFPKLLIIFKDT